MKSISPGLQLLFSGLCLLGITACHNNKIPAYEAINAMDLKRGKIILCGPPDKKLGLVSFKTSCSDKVQEDLNLALSLLHSFEYDEAEKVFAKIIDNEPG